MDRDVQALTERVDSLEARLRKYLLIGETGASGNSVTQGSLAESLGVMERFWHTVPAGYIVPTGVWHSLDMSYGGGGPLLDTALSYNAATPTYITIAKAGLYIVRLLAASDQVTAGTRLGLRIKSAYGAFGEVTNFSYVPGLAGKRTSHVLMDCKDLEAGHQLYFDVWQETGGNITLANANIKLFRIGDRSLPPDVFIA